MRIGLALATLLALAATAFAQKPATRAPEQPSWYESALKFVPPGTIAGYAVCSDETKLIGVVPVFRRLPTIRQNPPAPSTAARCWRSN